MNENMNEKEDAKRQITNENMVYENHTNERSGEETDSKRTDKQMPIRIQNRYSRIVQGIVWIGVGVFDIPHNPVCQNISMVCWFFSCFLLLRVALGSTERDDEMSAGSLIKARASTQVWMYTIYFSVWFLVAIIGAMPVHIEWGRLFAPTFLILMGLSDLITGIHFERLERE